MGCKYEEASRPGQERLRRQRQRTDGWRSWGGLGGAGVCEESMRVSAYVNAYGCEHVCLHVHVCELVSVFLCVCVHMCTWECVSMGTIMGVC